MCDPKPINEVTHGRCAHRDAAVSAIIQDTGGSSADILASGSIQFQVGEHGREGRELSRKPCASVPGLASGISSLGSSVASVMRL